MNKKLTFIFLLVILLLLGILAYAMIASFQLVHGDDKSEQDNQVTKIVSQPISTPLLWREIYPAEYGSETEGSYGRASYMYIGNFDNDADDEILRISDSELLIVDIDGEVEVIQQEEDYSSLWLHSRQLVWDYDRDGIDEIVPEPMMWIGATTSDANTTDNPTGQIDAMEKLIKTVCPLPVFNVNGGISGHVDAVFDEYLPDFGDVDGDGYTELICRTEVEHSEFSAYGMEGEIVWKCQTDPGEYKIALGNGCCGDFDGDGRDELLNVYNGVWLFGLDDERVELEDARHVGSYNMTACDIDADGYDELLTLKSIHDLMTGESIELQIEEEANPLIGHVVCGDLLAGAGNEIVVSSEMDRKNGRLFIFNQKGESIRRDEMEGPIVEIAMGESAGQTHMIVQVEDRILVFP